MKYTTLGRSGIQVSTLGLGSMVLGAWGNPDHASCARIVNRALDAGINLVDTADVDAFGETEELVGAAISGRRDEVVLATKFHNPMGEDVNARGNSRRWITQAVEASLRRLDTHRIDLYQVHRPDPTTDIAETVDALSDLVRVGKILAWGTSTFPAEDLVETCWAAERRGVAAPHSEQPPYSILLRGIERDVLPTCRRHGLGVIVWSPLAGGWLTGKYRRGAGRRPHADPDGDRLVDRAPGGDLGTHRSSHRGATRRPAHRRRRRARRDDARRHRWRRCSWSRPEPRRPWMDTSWSRRRVAPNTPPSIP